MVIDPGVGSDRAALAIVSDGRLLVGPDNGVLSPALLVHDARAVTLPLPAGASASFHGRDVFAPAAAALANGASLEFLGVPAMRPVVRRTPEPRRLGDGTVVGEVIGVDRFGNAITNLVGLRPGVVELGTAVLAVRRTYADVLVGAPLAIVGSSGLIEVAVREGNGARYFGLTRGSKVVFRAIDSA